MKHVYFIFIIAALLWEMMSLGSPKKMYEIKEELKSATKKSSKELTNNQNACLILMLLYGIWILVGLLTSQWPLFLLLLIISFIPKKHYIIQWFDAFVTIIILLFILLNVYHFHIDVWEYIKNLK